MQPGSRLLMVRVLVRSTQAVSLRYTDDWIARGFALSEDLPLLVTR